MNGEVILVTLETVGTCCPWRDKFVNALYAGLLALLLGVFDNARQMGIAGITAAASTVANDGLSLIICASFKTNPTHRTAVNIHVSIHIY